jgi:hypothetical protein
VVAATLTAPLVAAAGPDQTSAPVVASYVRASDQPTGSVPASSTSMSVLVSPVAGPLAAVMVPS